MRARNIKPSFFSNPDLGECSPLSRLCFAGLWCCADREGRVLNRPKFIKAQIFPYDNIDVEPLLSELIAFGFIELYETDGVKVIAIPNFGKHQRPHVKEKSSELPGKIEGLPRQEQAPTQVGASTDLNTNKPALNPECGILNVECGILNVECGIPAPVPDPIPSLLQEITSYWNSRMNQQCRITAKRKRAFSARSKDKWFVENWRAAIDAAAKSGFCCGDTGWTADLEWFLKPDSAEKLVEGKYAKTRSVVTQAQQREINSRSAREQWVEEMKSKGPDNWLPAGFIKGEMTFEND
jgi:hypothetical protein